MRQVYIDDDGAVRTVPAVECTGVAARWCPIHGSCTDTSRDGREPYADHCNDPFCPLHGAQSNHVYPSSLGASVEPTA